MHRYQYQRDGSRTCSAVASSQSAAHEWIRSIFPKGTQVWVYWPDDAYGSGYSYLLTC